MREIKFRAWDVEKGKMYTVSHIVFENMLNPQVLHIGIDRKQDPILSTGFERFNLMQSTGLKDKNGNEIYEGDIVEIWGGGDKPLTGVVNFEDGCFCLRWGKDCENKNPELKYYIDMDFCKPEIIGNVFQNKGLINASEETETD